MNVTRIGGAEVLILMIGWLIPLAVVGWLLSLAVRAVRALESIAQSLRSRQSP
ncbi:MAG TPA: hypothetical protein VNT01_04255 [Symbiobacteriaceae bacterium]|nr:hypothetical protein [Symbiobacteriaceae bacterium]